MIKRKLLSTIQHRLMSYPAVAIYGSRQSGKTTLAKTLAGIYFDLESEQEKLRLDLYWNEIILSDKLIILDEAQHFPDIFPRIRSAIDEDRKRNGRFLILGSVSPALMLNVSESLTGRIALCELPPLTLAELDINYSENLWLKGGYPDGGILDKSGFPEWQTNYLNLMAMRDLPLWGLPSKPQVTNRLFKMLAATNGQTWNASQIGKSLGLSYHTVNSYLDFLEQVYLIRRLHPYFNNIKKRLVKSPKVFWRDSGLLNSLLNINTIDNLYNHPGVGFSWEGWIIEQIVNHLKISDVAFDGPWFFRTKDLYELDLVMRINSKLWAVEIKLSSNPSIGDYKKLQKTARLIDADKVALISQVNEALVSAETFSGNIHHFFDYLIQSN